MATFKPELGLAVFGHPHQQFAVPDVMERALEDIRDSLDRVMDDERKGTYYNPFGNTGARFKCPVFQVEAFSWADDDQPFNFAWRDLRISWYKYLGRSMSANVEITDELAEKCRTECITALYSAPILEAGP